MDAVDKGDMETAGRIVEEAAKRAGFTLKVTHRTNVLPATVLHIVIHILWIMTANTISLGFQ